jgi:hypothetical protein
MRFSFLFFSFTLFYYFVYGAASAFMSRWCSCFLENDRTTRKREREMRWLRLLCLGKQQSIDLLFIIGHYFLPCSVYLSFFLSFFLSTPLICTHTLIRLYLSLRYISRMPTYMYKKNEVDDVSSIVILKRKVLVFQWHVFIKKEITCILIDWN